MIKAKPLTKVITALAFASGGIGIFADYARRPAAPRKEHKTDPAVTAELKARAEAKRKRKANLRSRRVIVERKA